MYYDQSNVATIGFGHAILKGEHFNEPLLPPDAQKLLEADINSKTAAINKMVQVPISQGQYDAVVSLAFNIGAGNFKKSNLLKAINKQQHSRAPELFLPWDEAPRGTHNRGLHTRRKVEASFYKIATPNDLVASN